jgi:hypothetical protein
VWTLPIGNNYVRGRIGKNIELEQCPSESARHGSSNGSDPDIADNRSGWLRRMMCWLMENGQVISPAPDDLKALQRCM